jgi:uncharacterized protein (DUF952 family)
MAVRRKVATLYKICPSSLWREAERTGVFHGSEHDLRDGLIHLSSTEQVAETAAKHFAGQSDLLLISVDAAALGDALKWEPSRGGAFFPHLYGALDLGAVIEVLALPLAPNGKHILPLLER